MATIISCTLSVLHIVRVLGTEMGVKVDGISGAVGADGTTMRAL